MEGSETGWGRPAEPAPRWRALLDRARLGRSAAEETGPDRSAPTASVEPSPRQPAGGYDAPAEPLPRRSAGGGNAARVPTLGQPSGLSYGEEAQPTYAADPRNASHPGEPAYRALRPDPGYRTPPPSHPDPRYPEPGPPPPPGQSRYALLDNGYRHAPPSENGYRPAPPSENGYPPESAYQPAVSRGYARVEWRPPSTVSGSERAAAVLRRELGGPRVLAFANPKGGVHKTTATVLAAATVGSVRGRGVLAWDDNELRGTLGLRAGSARHARTIRHLISDLAHIEIKDVPELLDHLDDYLRHASDGSYDVLAGEESPRFAQRLDQFTVRRVLELLRRTHDVICVDTGNNVESPNWRTVMQAADQLVVTTVPREDAAFSADWMLDLLHEVGMGELADNAVTLISCPTPGRTELRADLERHFATRTRAVTVVPYDPNLESGSSIEYHQLQPGTREAWLNATAVMLEPFAS